MPLPRAVRRRSPSTSLARSGVPPSSTPPLIIWMASPTAESDSSLPRSSRVRSSSKMLPTFSASAGGPEMRDLVPADQDLGVERGLDELQERVTLAEERHHRIGGPERGSSLGWWRSPSTSLSGRSPVPSCVERSCALMSCGDSSVARGGPSSGSGGCAGTVQPGWPGHLPPAQQVEVEVEHALAGVGADVRDETPTARGDALGIREVRGGLRQVSASTPPGGSRSRPPRRCVPSGSTGCGPEPAGSGRGTPRRCRRRA